MPSNMNLRLEHVLRECRETGEFQKCVQFHISWRISHMMNFVCRSNLKNLKFSEIKERESRQRQHFSLCIHPIHKCNLTVTILHKKYSNPSVSAHEAFHKKCALTRMRTNRDRIYVVKGTMTHNMRTYRD